MAYLSLAPGASVTNARSISRADGSIKSAGADANTLTLRTGSVLTGAAVGSSPLAQPTRSRCKGTGEADNVFDNFTTRDVQAAGDWTLGGAFTIGAITVSSRTLIVTGAVTSDVTLSGGRAAAEFKSSFGGNVIFQGADALSLSQP